MFALFANGARAASTQDFSSIGTNPGLDPVMWLIRCGTWDVGCDKNLIRVCVDINIDITNVVAIVEGIFSKERYNRSSFQHESRHDDQATLVGRSVGRSGHWKNTLYHESSRLRMWNVVDDRYYYV